MKNKEIVNELKLLNGRVTELEGNKEKEKPKFEVDKWYKNILFEQWLCYFDGKKYLYGFDGDGDFQSKLDKSESKSMCNDDYLATHEEVKARLIEYWEKDNKPFDAYYFYKNELTGEDVEKATFCTLLNDRGKWVHSNPKKRTLTIEEAEKEFNVKIKQ